MQQTARKQKKKRATDTRPKNPTPAREPQRERSKVRRKKKPGEWNIQHATKISIKCPPPPLEEGWLVGGRDRWHLEGHQVCFRTGFANAATAVIILAWCPFYWYRFFGWGRKVQFVSHAASGVKSNCAHLPPEDYVRRVLWSAWGVS